MIAVIFEVVSDQSRRQQTWTRPPTVLRNYGSHERLQAPPDSRAVHD